MRERRRDPRLVRQQNRRRAGPCRPQGIDLCLIKVEPLVFAALYAQTIEFALLGDASSVFKGLTHKNKIGTLEWYALKFVVTTPRIESNVRNKFFVGVEPNFWEPLSLRFLFSKIHQPMPQTLVLKLWIDGHILNQQMAKIETNSSTACKCPL